jgi:hypothetical protein
MMDLATVVKTYLDLTGGFDLPLHLSRLGLPKPEVERIFSAWDEDYQISRFVLLSRGRDDELEGYPDGLRVFRVNGYESSHVTFRSGIQQLVESV